MIARSAAVTAGLVMTGLVAAQDSFRDQVERPPQPVQQAPAMQPATPQIQPGIAGPQGGQSSATDAQQSAGQGPDFSRVTRMERQESGVQATSTLHSGVMHGPTPTSIPGGQVIDTQALYAMLQQNPNGVLLFDVLGGSQILPNALAAAPASAPGSFNDETQQGFGQFLNDVTQGNRATRLVFYCQSIQCWMSYNAALRAINLGYTQVMWYRGGIEAWQSVGLPTQRVY